MKFRPSAKACQPAGLARPDRGACGAAVGARRSKQARLIAIRLYQLWCGNSGWYSAPSGSPASLAVQPSTPNKRQAVMEQAQHALAQHRAEVGQRARHTIIWNSLNEASVTRLYWAQVMRSRRRQQHRALALAISK
jgi:hypothetical protein